MRVNGERRTEADYDSLDDLELDAVVKKAAEKKARDDARRGVVEPEGPTLMPASETGALEETHEEPAYEDEAAEE